MPARKRRKPGGYPEAIFMRLEGSARVGWAKWYQEVRANNELEEANSILRERIETLIPVCLSLVDDVLYERNVQAFHTAWEVDRVIRKYCKGQRGDSYGTRS